MPQLMPLNWVVSSGMIFLVLVGACAIYSMVEKKMSGKGLLSSSIVVSSSWYW